MESSAIFISSACSLTTSPSSISHLICSTGTYPRSVKQNHLRRTNRHKMILLSSYRMFSHDTIGGTSCVSPRVVGNSSPVNGISAKQYIWMPTLEPPNRVHDPRLRTREVLISLLRGMMSRMEYSGLVQVASQSEAPPRPTHQGPMTYIPCWRPRYGLPEVLIMETLKINACIFSHT